MAHPLAIGIYLKKLDKLATAGSANHMKKLSLPQSPVVQSLYLARYSYKFRMYL